MCTQQECNWFSPCRKAAPEFDHSSRATCRVLGIHLHFSKRKHFLQIFSHFWKFKDILLLQLNYNQLWHLVRQQEMGGTLTQMCHIFWSLCHIFLQNILWLQTHSICHEVWMGH